MPITMMGMDISQSTAVEATLKAMDVTGSREVLQNRLQVALLKKSLEVQQEQAAEITRMVEGKGRVIDLRV
jgi:hypothetical protein